MSFWQIKVYGFEKDWESQIVTGRKIKKDFEVEVFCGATRSVFDPNNRCKIPSIGINNDFKI
jgi:regulation of enolase protein 1 (concanavalin A-like superfamily)